MKEFNRETVNYAYLGNFKALSVTEDGCRILLDTRNPQHLKIISHGVYEKAVSWAIKKYLQPGQTFVDIGANIGFFTLLGCKIVGPKGKVFALEPNPVIFEMMDSSVFANSFGKRCERKNVAAFNEDGELELTWDSAKHGGGRLVTNEKVSLDENRKVVNLQRLDDILSENDRPISVIKIDTEGSEPFILEGAEQTLKDNPQCVVIAEWSPRFVKSRGYDFEKYLDYLFDTFGSIELLKKVGVTQKVNRKELASTHHGNVVLKQS